MRNGGVREVVATTCLHPS